MLTIRRLSLFSGGLNLHEASLHTPAAFIASSTQSVVLVSRMLDRPPQPSPHFSQALDLFSAAANHPDWLSLTDIDVPL